MYVLSSLFIVRPIQAVPVLHLHSFILLTAKLKHEKKYPLTIFALKKINWTFRVTCSSIIVRKLKRKQGRIPSLTCSSSLSYFSIQLDRHTRRGQSINQGRFRQLHFNLKQCHWHDPNHQPGKLHSRFQRHPLLHLHHRFPLLLGPEVGNHLRQQRFFVTCCRGILGGSLGPGRLSHESHVNRSSLYL